MPSIPETALYAAFFLLLVVQVLDVASTQDMIGRGGVEANPVVAETLTAGGVPAFVALKVALTAIAAAFVAVLVSTVSKHFPTALPATYVASAIIISFIVARHVVAIARNAGVAA